MGVVLSTVRVAAGLPVFRPSVVRVSEEAGQAALLVFEKAARAGARLPPPVARAAEGDRAAFGVAQLERLNQAVPSLASAAFLGARDGPRGRPYVASAVGAVRARRADRFALDAPENAPSPPFSIRWPPYRRCCCEFGS